jgi:hypothetical protein
MSTNWHCTESTKRRSTNWHGTVPGPSFCRPENPFSEICSSVGAIPIPENSWLEKILAKWKRATTGFQFIFFIFVNKSVFICAAHKLSFLQSNQVSPTYVRSTCPCSKGRFLSNKFPNCPSDAIKYMLFRLEFFISRNCLAFLASYVQFGNISVKNRPQVSRLSSWSVLACL